MRAERISRAIAPIVVGSASALARCRTGFSLTLGCVNNLAKREREERKRVVSAFLLGGEARSKGRAEFIVRGLEVFQKLVFFFFVETFFIFMQKWVMEIVTLTMSVMEQNWGENFILRLLNYAQRVEIKVWSFLFRMTK